MGDFHFVHIGIVLQHKNTLSIKPIFVSGTFRTGAAWQFNIFGKRSAANAYDIY